jgi:hypothetical protein
MARFRGPAQPFETCAPHPIEVAIKLSGGTNLNRKDRVSSSIVAQPSDVYYVVNPIWIGRFLTFDR